MNPTLRLKFVPESTGILHDRREKFVEGADATDVLEAWRTDTGSSGFGWGNYLPEDFRARIVAWSGAEIELPAEDDEILAAVVEALGPEVVVLERLGRTG